MEMKHLPLKNESVSRKLAAMTNIDFANGKAGAWDLSGPRTDVGGFFTQRLMRNSPARAFTMKQRQGANHESMKNLAVNSNVVSAMKNKNDALR